MSTSTQSSISSHAEHILAAALDFVPEDRDAFLVNSCGDDAEMLAELRTLVAANEAMPTGFFSKPAVTHIAATELDVTIKVSPGGSPQRTGTASTSGSSE